MEHRNHDPRDRVDPDYEAVPHKEAERDLLFIGDGYAKLPPGDHSPPGHRTCTSPPQPRLHVGSYVYSRCSIKPLHTSQLRTQCPDTCLHILASDLALCSHQCYQQKGLRHRFGFYGLLATCPPGAWCLTSGKVSVDLCGSENLTKSLNAPCA